MSVLLLRQRIYLLQVITGCLLRGSLRRTRKSSRTTDLFSKKLLLFFLAYEKADSGCISIHSFYFQFTQERVLLDFCLDAGYGFQNL